MSGSLNEESIVSSTTTKKYVSKDTIKKMKKKKNKQREETFANHTPDKGLISRMCKEHLQLNNEETVNSKMAREFKQVILQRRYGNGKQAHGKIFNSSGMLQIKTTTIHHSHTLRWL